VVAVVGGIGMRLSAVALSFTVRIVIRSHAWRVLVLQTGNNICSSSHHLPVDWSFRVIVQYILEQQNSHIACASIPDPPRARRITSSASHNTQEWECTQH
jgi:hypothetical protein